MPNDFPQLYRKSSWQRTLLRVLFVCLGSVGILLPAWLPNHSAAPIKTATVEILQASLLAAAAAVILGASGHAGQNRPVCRVMALGLFAAFIGEIEDVLSSVLKLNFPEGWVIGLTLFLAALIAFHHRRVMVGFFSTLGNHAGAGLVGSALLIIYVFNRVVGSEKFWRATLGSAFSADVPKICKSYLELFACYLIFIGTLGLSITLARRKEPS